MPFHVEKPLHDHARRLIHDHLEYSYTVTATYAEARALETSVRKREAFGAKPFLNPL